MRRLRKLIRLPKVREVSGLGTTKIYDLEGKGLFPKRVKLTARSVAWVEDEIAELNEAVIAGRSEDEIAELIKAQVAARKQSNNQSSGAR